MSLTLVHLSPSLLPPCSSEPPSSPRQTPAAAPNCSSCLLAPFQDPDGKVIFQNAKHIMSLPGRLGSKPALALPSSHTLLPCSLYSGLMGFCQSLSTLLPHLFSLPPCTTPHLVNPGSSFSLEVIAQASPIPLLQFLIGSCSFSHRELISVYNRTLFSVNFPLMSVSAADCEALEGRNQVCVYEGFPRAFGTDARGV